MQTTYQMQLSTTVDKKRVPLGSIPVRIFDLSEFGADLPAATSEKDGLPVYQDASLNWLQEAVTSAITAKARNSVNGLEYKAGISPCLSVADLLASGGSYMATNALFQASFDTFLEAASGKSAKAQAVFSSLVKLTARASLASASEARRSALAGVLAAYTAQAPDSEVAQFAGILSTLQDLCAGVGAVDDSEL